MKKKVQNPLMALLTASLLMVGSIAYGATYTAVASGNWSSAATWGGSAPPFNVTGADQINVGVGITVTMDQNVTLNNALADIDVAGTLTGASNVKLEVVTGNLTGAGNINASNVALDAAGTFNFTGSLTADTLTNAIVSLSNSAQVTVNSALELPSALSIMIGGSLTMGNNSNIDILGGSIAVVGGTLNLTSNYNVSYLRGAINTGAELTGNGLKNVTVNVGAGNNVALTGNLVVNDSLKFGSGALALNGNNLTVNGALSGSILLNGSMNSNLTINTAGGVAAAIMFNNGFQNINNLAINVGAGNAVKLGSSLAVAGTLTLTGGSKLDITGQTLVINGDLNGNGSLVVNGGSQLNIVTNNAITGNISLTGSDLGKFMLNIGNGNKATLATNLVVDTLSLQGGELALNSNSLVINAGIAANGNGMIASNGASNISVSSSASLKGSLAFDAAADTVNNLNVNVGGGGSLNLGSDLMVKGALAFTAGYVNVQSNNLTIGAAGSITGANSNAYVITGSNGYLTMQASVGNATMFAVGTGTGYFPASITLNAGSAVGKIGVNVSAGVYSAGVGGVKISDYEPMVNATWLFQNNIGNGLNANMQLYWQASAEVNGFIHTGDYISHYAAAWDMSDTMTAAFSGNLYSVTRANVVSMSPFAVFDQSTVPTGVGTVASASDGFQVYPNPTHEDLYINNPSISGVNTVYVEVYNTLGQVIAKTQYNNEMLVLPVTSLPPGTYLLRLYNDNMSVVKKFIKE